MTREQIETRIRMMQERLAQVTHPDDIATCNRIIERLIMMEPEPEGEQPDDIPL